MNCLDLVPADLHKFYEFREWRNPCAVLSVAYPDEWANIISILGDFRILRTDVGEVGTKGGGKSLVAIRMDKMFKAKGWEEKRFDTRILVNDQPIDSPTHGVDCFKGKVAQHSRKPDEQYQIIEACSPGPYLELFARGLRQGWTTWGNQADDGYHPSWATYAHHSRAVIAAE
jgi:hypothetical protein